MHQRSTAAVAAPQGHLGRQEGVLISVRDGGFGFIRNQASGLDFFVNIKDFPNRALWRVGQRVTFIPVSAAAAAKRAPRALHIELA